MRTIPDPGFPDDDGRADASLRAALHRYALDSRAIGVLTALPDARLLVPVVAVLDEAGVDGRGLAVDKSSDMAAVLMKGRDGRQALLAFSGTDSLQAWQPSARPVPVSARHAATAACQEGASALLIDVAGPVRFALQGDDLLRVAAGDTLVPFAGGHAWRPRPRMRARED